LSPLGGGKKEELTSALLELRERLDYLQQVLSEQVNNLQQAVRDLSVRVGAISGVVRQAMAEGTKEVMIESMEAAFKAHAETVKDRLYEALDELVKLRSVIEAYKADQDRFVEYLKLQYDTIEDLQKAKVLLEEERRKLEEERAKVEALREETLRLRAELEEREKEIREVYGRVQELEERKALLERQIREMEERYFKLLEAAARKVEATFNDLDRRFRVREARLLRLARLEELKKEEIRKLEEEKAVLESYRRQFEDLMEDIRRLEKRKEQLESEIRKLESQRMALRYGRTELDEGEMREG
jgi:chromosome segregation ATPase